MILTCAAHAACKLIAGQSCSNNAHASLLQPSHMYQMRCQHFCLQADCKVQELLHQGRTRQLHQLLRLLRPTITAQRNLSMCCLRGPCKILLYWRRICQLHQMLRLQEPTVMYSSRPQHVLPCSMLALHCMQPLRRYSRWSIMLAWSVDDEMAED